MGVWSALSWLRKGYRWHDSLAVEQSKTSLDANLDSLSQLLAEIRYPASEDPDDPENPISKEDWAALEARGEAAKDEVPDVLSSAQRTLRGFSDALNAEEAAIGARLRSVNEQLT
jgi:hypothetical protein